MVRAEGVECCKSYPREGGLSELRESGSLSPHLHSPAVSARIPLVYTLFQLSVLPLYDFKETWMPEVQVSREMWNAKNQG